MQFQVPQFLDVEDKIVGPFTLKQFLYLIGSIGMAYITWRFLWAGIGHFLALALIAFGSALAFYRPNKKPFVYMIEAGFLFYKGSRLYIWQRRKQEKMETHLDLGNFQATVHTGSLPVSTGKESKLDDLSWAIDVQASAVEGSKTHTDSLVM